MLMTTSLLLAIALFGAASGTAEAAPASAAFPIVELRQYTLHPGKRDTLITLFENEFVESQEALGMKLFGQFTDLDNPDRFVWIRGFKDMEARAAGLNAFYFGPVWKAHREAANPTMVDSDNVLLLRAPRLSAAFAPGQPRPAAGSPDVPGSMVIATIYYLNGDADDFVEFFEHDIAPGLRAAGIPVLAYFVPEKAANNFPALPVKEGEQVFVWFSKFTSQADYEKRRGRFERSINSNAQFNGALTRAPQILRLRPTARSELR